MIRKLLFLLMLCVTSIGAWADETILIDGGSDGVAPSVDFKLEANAAVASSMQEGDFLRIYYHSNSGGYTYCDFGYDNNGYNFMFEVNTNSGDSDAQTWTCKDVQLNQTQIDNIHNYGLKVNGWGSASNITLQKLTLVHYAAATGVTLNKTSLSLGIGNTDETLKAIVEPAEGANQTVTWSVETGSEYVSVNATTGELTGIAAGTATVRATSVTNASLYAECTVTVKQGYTLSLAADKTTVLNTKNDEVTLTPTVGLEGQTPVEGTDYNIDYTIDDNADPTNVTISGNVVTIAAGATAGTYTVVATLTPKDDTYAGATATKEFVVDAPVENAIHLTIGDQTFAKSAGAPTVGGGLTIDNTAFSNISETTFTFTAESDDNDVVSAAWTSATVNQHNNEVVFTINGAGETDVTLTVDAVNTAGKVTTTTKKIRVTVTGDPLKIKMNDITINDDQSLTLDAIMGAITQIYTGADDNPTIVESGYTIEVMYDGSPVESSISPKDADYQITVYVNATDVNYVSAEPLTKTVTVTHLKSFTLALNADKTTIKTGEVATITPSSMYNDTDIAIASYACTSNEAVATAEVVDGKIVVTGVNDGTTTITVTATPEDDTEYTVMTNTIDITVSNVTTGTVERQISEDGKTITFVCSGDVCNPAHAGSGNYWDNVADEINVANYETVVFTTKEGDTEHATICEHVTRAMMKTTKVNALDYQFVQIESLEPLSIYVDGSWQDNPKSTFWASSKNTSVTVLLLPEIKKAKEVNGVEHRHVPQVCNNFWSLNLIVMPNNATCIEENAFVRNSFNGGITEYELKTIIFNNTLKRIGNHAFEGHIGLNNLTFPASIEYIGANAFDGGIKDVYFLGKNAPIVEKTAFCDKAYLCNNAIKDNYIINDWYRVDRNAYVNGDYMAAQLHLPTGLSDKQRAAYTDPTRDYHVFEWLPYEIATDETSEEAALAKYPFAIGAESREVQGQTKIYVKFDAIHSDDISKEVDGFNGQTRAMVYYCSGDASGKDISPSWGSAASGANAYLDGGRVWGDTDWINGFNHNKSSGLYDLYAGTNYVWPCQANMNRAFDVASHGLLWNGTKTIADGINGTSNGEIGTVTSTYDSDCDGVDDKSYTDGKEYMGLHEFVLASYDVSPETNTQEWDFNTIAGQNWYTICVPVSMTVEEVRKTFGERTQVCKFNSISRDSHDKIKFGFTDEQCFGKKDLTAIAIQANVAYMIHPAAYDGADNKFTLPHYTIADKVIPIPTTLTCSDENDGEPNKVYSYTFIGNYNTNADGTPLYMQKYTYYLGADSKNPQLHKLFIQTGETGKWKPYSCVIIPSDGKADYDTFFDPNRAKPHTSTSKSTTCYFGMDAYEEECNTAPTVIEYTYECGSDNAPVYNLNGQYVGSNKAKLAAGVYVQNGKKFIVK